MLFLLNSSITPEKEKLYKGLKEAVLLNCLGNISLLYFIIKRCNFVGVKYDVNLIRMVYNNSFKFALVVFRGLFYKHGF